MEENNAGLSETLDLAKHHLLAVWRFRWLMMIVAIVVSLAGVPAVTLLPDKYEASTRLFIDTKTMLKPILKGLAVDTNIAVQFADITRRTLFNTTNIERIMREADLDLAVDNQKERFQMVEGLKQSINIASFSGSKKRGQMDNFYTITYEHSDPQKAYAVVQATLDIFIENSLGASRKDSSMTESFLNEQIAQYEERLEEAEEKLKKFKQANVNSMPSQAGGYFAKFNASKEALRMAELQLREANERAKNLNQQLLNLVDSLNSDAGGKVLSSIDIRIRNFEEQLDELSLQFTDQHPNITAIKDMIAELEKKKQKTSGQGALGAVSNNGLIENKLYQELTIEQGRTMAEASALTVRVREYRGEVTRLQALIGTIPDIEARLAQLNRDYEINKEKYLSFVNRREAANISKQAEISADQVVFKIIEAPKVPLVPLSPNRPLLLLVVYAVALGLGVGLAWLFAQFKPTIYNSKQLTERFGFSVLGSVSVVVSDKQKRNERRKLFAIICIMLIHFAVFMTLVASEYLYEDPLALIKIIV